eukprot:Partr_v1_DN28867_c1_g1_i2_m32898 putative GTPase activating protein
MDDKIKIHRRLRLFFDDKQKTKHRLLALYAFLDNAANSEILDLLKDHQSLVFSLLDAGYERRSTKIKAAAAERSDKIAAFKMKHCIELTNICAAVRHIVLAAGHLDSWWSRPGVVDFIMRLTSQLLHYDNEHKLRLEGYRLVLLAIFVNERMQQRVMVDLLISSIVLSPFSKFVESEVQSTSPFLTLRESSHLRTTSPPVCLSLTPPSVEDACELFDELLYSLVAAASRSPSFYSKTSGSDAESLARISRLFAIIRDEFLHPMFPKFSSSLDIKFSRCPPEFLRSLINLLSRFSVKSSPYECSRLLNAFFFADRQVFQYSLEIVTCSIGESPSYPITVRYALHVLKNWMLIPTEEFALASNLSPVDLHDRPSENEVNNAIIFQSLDILERLFAVVDNVLDQKECAHQTAIYIEAVSIFRNVVLSPCSMLEVETCEKLQWTLLNILRTLLSTGRSRSVVNGVMDMLVETILVIWVRAATKKVELWDSLHEHLLEAFEVSSIQTILQWGRIMKSLATIYCKEVLKVDLSSVSHLPMSVRKKSSMLHDNIVRPTVIRAQRSILRQFSESFALDAEEENDKSSLSPSPGLRHAAFLSMDGMNMKPSEAMGDGSRFFTGISSKGGSAGGYSFVDETHKRFREVIDMYRDIEIAEGPGKVLKNLNKRTENEFGLLDDLPFWNEFAATFMYRRMLRVLGNINTIKDPLIHYEAFLALANVIDLFLLSRQHQPWNSPSVPPLFEFCVFFLDSTKLPPAFKKSQCISYTNITRLICRKINGLCDDPDPPSAFFSQAYASLIRGLFETDPDIVSSILSGSDYIFSRNLPSIEILIPVYVLCIARWIGMETDVLVVPVEYISIGEISLSGESISHAATILLSLLAPMHAVSLNDVVPIAYFAGNVSKCGTISYRKLHLLIRQEIAWLCTEYIPNRGLGMDCINILLSGATQLAFHELEVRASNSGFDQLAFEKALSILLRNLHSDDHRIALIAVDCLSCFTHSPELLKGLPDSLLRGIIDQYLASISESLFFVDNISLDTKEMIVSRFLYGMLDWLMIMPQEVLGDERLKCNIFEIVENIFVEAIHDDEEVQAKKTYRSRKPTSENNLAGSSIIKPESPSFFAASFGGSGSRSPVEEKPVECASPIKEAVENFVLHLLHFYGNFPFPAGYAAMSSFANESNAVDEETPDLSVDRKVFSFNGKVVVSVELHPGHARILVRNTIGKFGWICSIGQLENPGMVVEEEEVMTSESYPAVKGFDNSEEAMSQDDRAQWAAISNIVQNHKPSPYTLLRYEEGPPAALPTPSIYAILRQLHMLDSHLESRRPGAKKTLQFLNETSTALWRDIRGLDKKSGRETVKVAVLYVGPGQEDEYSILGNEKANTSLDFQDFIKSLGWTIDVETHAGFLAGLERSGATGKSATYYCTSTLEMIFHDVTQMPTDHTDTKQIKKKRHIGNDHVHIIWNDHHRAYKPSTIAGDFGNVQLIITPMPNSNHYSLEIRKGSEMTFGPLVSGMVVSRFVLGRLVRLTAIHAYRASLLLESNGVSSAGGYRRPFHHRLNDIKLITARHAVPDIPWVQ